MEGLVLIIGELLIALMMPVFSVLAGVVAAFAELVLGLLALAFGGQRRARPVQKAKPVSPATVRKIRKGVHWVTALGGAVSVSVLVLSWVFLTRPCVGCSGGSRSLPAMR